MAVIDHDVKCYEYIIDYFEHDDSTDEQEMLSRLRVEQEGDSRPEPFEHRSLAVEPGVLKKHAH